MYTKIATHHRIAVTEMRVWVVVVVGSLMVCQQRWYLNTEMMSKHSG